MPASLKTVYKVKPKTNGSIDSYNKKTKEELIKEIKELKKEINYYQGLENKRKVRQNNCLKELENIIKK